VQCAGLISESGLDAIGVKPRDCVLNRVRGARIHSPGGMKIEVDAGRHIACAVDRLLFDRHMQEMAIDAGAKYVDDWVTSVGGSVKLKRGGSLKADRIVLATGTDYGILRGLGMDRPREFLIGGQYEMEVDCDEDFVELYFTVPDFFAWVIPLGDRARVGLCVKTNPRPYLDSFVKRLEREGRIRSGRVLSETFGVIPIHDPRTRTERGNIVSLGDAAGQVKATTGGGIVFGALAAKYACEPGYNSAWRRSLGFDLRLHLMVHRMLCRLSDRGKDRLFRIVGESHEALEKKGDMDSAKKTVCALSRDPAFLFKTAANLPMLLADMM